MNWHLVKMFHIYTKLLTLSNCKIPHFHLFIRLRARNFQANDWLCFCMLSVFRLLTMMENTQDGKKEAEAEK